MGVDFHEITIWIETIRDKAATEGIDHKSAISLIVQDLKLYNQYNTLQKAIHKRQQDLEALNIVVEEHKGAIASLVDLKRKGISDTEIIELNGLTNSRSTGGGWNMLNLRLDDKLNLALPNGKNSLQQPSNGNNGYGDGNLSMNDLIRLNLLKGSNTNMLNRIGSGVSIVKDAPHNLLTDTAAIQCVLSENSMKGDAIGVVFSTFSGNTSVMSASGGTGFMRGFFGSGPIFRFAPGVSLQYQFQELAPSRQIQITLAGAPLAATDNTTLQTNLNDMRSCCTRIRRSFTSLRDCNQS